MHNAQERLLVFGWAAAQFFWCQPPSRAAGTKKIVLLPSQTPTTSLTPSYMQAYFFAYFGPKVHAQLCQYGLGVCS